MRIKSLLLLFIEDECPNIVRYVDTIKATYWPDWNKHIRAKN